MFYSFKLNGLPVITDYYSVIRNTVWQIADEHHIVIYIRDGSCRIFCDNELYTLKQGDVFFIPKGHEYKRTPIDDSLCTLTYIHFKMDTDVSTKSFEELKNEIITTKNTLDIETLNGEKLLSYPDVLYLENLNTLKKCEHISDLISNVNIFSNKRQLMCNLQTSVNLCNLLIALTSDTIEKVLTNSNIKTAPIIPTKLKKAIGYIARHYSEQITLDELSRYCTVSKQQMIRYFKASLNTTPLQYITEYRISRAKELLCNHSHLTIKEISAELGFENQHYFSRVFKKITGFSPLAYKNQAEYNKFHNTNPPEKKKKSN